MGYGCLLVAVGLGGACTTDAPMCGAGGESLEYEGEAYCYYRAAITEEGFRCPESFPFRFDFPDFTVCSGHGEIPPDLERHVRMRTGDAGMLSDAGVLSDAGHPADADVVGMCWDAWAAPVARVEATSRPSSVGMTLDFDYGLDGTGGSEIVLVNIRATEIARESDGPFSIETHSGSWVEVRDASDTTLYTRNVFELIPESVEVFPDPDSDAGMGRLFSCPDDGSLRVSDLRLDPAAVDVVFFASVIDGRDGPTVELARFRLP